MNWIENVWHPLGWARRALPQCKVWGDRTARAGCRCKNVVFVLCYRQDAANRQTGGIKFTHKPKICIFAPQGRLVAPIHVKFCTTKGSALSHENSCESVHVGGNWVPKISKLSTFYRQTAAIKFSHRPKITIFYTQERTKFRANRCTGWERGTQKLKISTFW